MRRPSKYPISLLNLKARRASDQRLNLLVKGVALAPSIFRMVSTIHEHYAFLKWLNGFSLDRRHPGYRQFKTRQQLWDFLAKHLRQFSDTHIFEFGVANGDGARYWLGALENVSYHGFDCFTGMPAQYRQVPAGVFNLGGRPPDINDHRVTWHVGLIEKTLPGFAVPRTPHRMFIFDLDLYEPTLQALETLRSVFQPGDLLYFDEAFDNAEGVAARSFFETENNFVLFGSATGCMTLIAI